MCDYVDVLTNTTTPQSVNRYRSGEKKRKEAPEGAEKEAKKAKKEEREKDRGKDKERKKDKEKKEKKVGGLMLFFRLWAGSGLICSPQGIGGFYRPTNRRTTHPPPPPTPTLRLFLQKKKKKKKKKEDKDRERDRGDREERRSSSKPSSSSKVSRAFVWSLASSGTPPSMR